MFSHAQGIRFEDHDASVQMILGVAHAETWIGGEIRRGTCRQPSFVKTLFGWTAVGGWSKSDDCNIACFATQVDDNSPREDFYKIFDHDSTPSRFRRDDERKHHVFSENREAASQLQRRGLERMVALAERRFQFVPEKALHFDVLNTSIVEIKRTVNRRPLSAISVSAGDYEALIPAHIPYPDAIPHSPALVMENASDDYAEGMGCSWRRAQFRVNAFWKKWRREFITLLRGRSKWQRTRKDIGVGNLALLVANHMCEAEVCRTDGRIVLKDGARVVLSEIDDGGTNQMDPKMENATQPFVYHTNKAVTKERERYFPSLFEASFFLSWLTGSCTIVDIAIKSFRHYSRRLGIGLISNNDTLSRCHFLRLPFVLCPCHSECPKLPVIAFHTCEHQPTTYSTSHQYHEDKSRDKDNNDNKRDKDDYPRQIYNDCDNVFVLCHDVIGGVQSRTLCAISEEDRAPGVRGAISSRTTASVRPSSFEALTEGGKSRGSAPKGLRESQQAGQVAQRWAVSLASSLSSFYGSAVLIEQCRVHGSARAGAQPE